MVSRYIELTVTAPKEPNQLIVRACDYRGGIVSEASELNPQSDDMRDLLRKLERCFQQKDENSHRMRSDLQAKLGSRLFEGIVTGEVRVMYEACRMSSDISPLRIRLNIEAEELAGLPWELMYDPKRESWLSRDADVTFSRFASLREGSRKLEFSPPLRILLSLSNPLGLGDLELDLDRERDKIHSAVNTLTQQGSAELEILSEEVTLEKMYQRMIDDVNVVHFSGHGGISKNHRMMMLLENDEGRRRDVPFDEFVSLLGGLRSVIAVVLDACELAAGAPKVLTKKVPVVIAMRGPIFDQSATIFFEEFYKGMASGLAIDEAVTRARNNLVAKYREELVDWFTPVLYHAPRDGGILLKERLAPQVVSPPKAVRCDELIALRDVGRFVGRRRIVRELREKLYDRDTRIIVIEGLSGDGKTSLVSKVVQEELQSFKAVFSHVVTADTSFETLLALFNEFLEKNKDTSLSVIWSRPDLSVEVKVDAMAKVLGGNRYLLFLDGFQSLVSERRIADGNIKRFLELVLTRRTPSKIVITTWERFELAEGGFLVPFHTSISAH